MQTVRDSVSQIKQPRSTNNDLPNKKNQWLEIPDNEDLKKIDAYIEWEQEYYIINQSYLLENIGENL